MAIINKVEITNCRSGHYLRITAIKDMAFKQVKTVCGFKLKVSKLKIFGYLLIISTAILYNGSLATIIGLRIVTY